MANWIDQASHSIRQRVPEAAALPDFPDYVTERLSAILLERMPPTLSRKLFDLLPEDYAALSPELRHNAESPPDPSIGYAQFIEVAERSIGVSEIESQDPLERVAERIADVFLGSVSEGFPDELKQELERELPMELKARMNLGMELRRVA